MRFDGGPASTLATVPNSLKSAEREGSPYVLTRGSHRYVYLYYIPAVDESLIEQQLAETQ